MLFSLVLRRILASRHLLLVWISCSLFCILFFFFKQKTAYEMLRSLVGSEMCIRDRSSNWDELSWGARIVDYLWHITLPVTAMVLGSFAAVSYTHLTLPTIYSV